MKALSDSRVIACVFKEYEVEFWAERVGARKITKMKIWKK
jgi:hypothetical protein